MVSEATLKVITDISTIQAPVDAAQDALNALISFKRSPDFTRTEIENLGVDVGPLNVELAKMKTSIGTAAAAYATV